MTRTETALRALKAALTSQSVLGAIRRNVALDELLEDVGAAAGLSTGLLLEDGDAIIVNETLGNQDDVFEIQHTARIGWVVAGNDEDDRETRFDDGLAAIAAALAGDQTLGGTVSSARIAAPPERSTEIAGARTAKLAVVGVEMTFTAPTPF